jgi:hypothetical protein
MGAWGKLPWDNDGAADWFGDLFEKTKLAKHVEDTLRLDVQDSHEEIRAAASVLLFLGHSYIWPVKDLDRQLTLAADRLEEISRVTVIAESPEFVDEIHRDSRAARSHQDARGTTIVAFGKEVVAVLDTGSVTHSKFFLAINFASPLTRFSAPSTL